MDHQEPADTPNAVPSGAGGVARGIRDLGGVPWRRLFGYLRPELKPFSIALVGLVVGSGLSLLVPLVVGGLVGAVVAGGDAAILDRLIAGLVVLFLAQSLGGFVQGYFLGVVGERVVARLRGELFERLVTLSLDFHGRNRVGELVSRLSSDVTLIRTMLTQTTTSLLSSLIGLVGSVTILFLLNPTLLAVVLVLAPALIAIAIVFGRPLQRVSTEVQDAIAHSTVTAEEALSGIRVVKSYVRESFEVSRYGGDLAGVVGAGTRLALWRAAFGALMGFLGFGAVAVLLWYTGHRVIEGSLGVGTLTGFLLYGITIGGSLATIAGLYGQFREGTGAVTRVFELIDTRPTIVDAPGAVEIGHVDGAIEIDGVTFAYDGSNAVLRDVSLSIAPGEVLALVGPSGAGKTTLVGLLPRLWDATSGAIRIDGRDVREVTTASLRARIGLVPQEATLFGGTIRDNIRYGRLEATQDEIVAAARSANAHEFITALPDGYDTLVGDRGPPLRRPAPAGRHRPRDPQGPADPAPRRGDELARQRVRAAGPGGAGSAEGRPDDDHRRAPPVHDPGRPPHRGPRRRLAGGAGHPRRAAGPRRPVCPPLPAAVLRGCSGLRDETGPALAADRTPVCDEAPRIRKPPVMRR